MADTVMIPKRFNGPPKSGNGGYACGVAAAALGGGPAEVSLRVPPPLETPLEAVTTDSGVDLLAGGQVVASARPWDGSVELPELPSPAEVQQAMSTFDVEDYADAHPFATCFTCGPARPEGDGIGFCPAPVAEGTVAWMWTPHPSDGAADGLVEPAVVWAALDCPSGQAWLTAEGRVDGQPIVLGRLAARIHRRPAAGEELVLYGWRTGGEGRKRLAASALRTEAGELLAEGSATWVVLSPEQAAAFTATS